MNDTEIDAMPAGRAMDALIAEHIMGLEPWPGIPGAFRAPIVLNWQTPAPCVPPEYSADIAAAWEVVKKFSYGFAPMQVAAVVEFRVLDGVAPGCECRIFSPTLAPVYASANDMPLAICRAALKALQAVPA